LLLLPLLPDVLHHCLLLLLEGLVPQLPGAAHH
jgi:hypothetical protein